MRKMVVVALGVGFCFFILRLLTFIKPEFICVLLSIVLGVVLLAVLVVAVIKGVKKRKASNLWLVPVAICLAFLVGSFEGAPSLGRKIADRIFTKHVAEFAGTVSDFKSGRLTCATSCSGKVGSIEAASRPADVLDIWGARCDDGGAIVLFRVKTDVPLLHEGYFFKDYSPTSNCGLSSLSPETSWPHAPYVRRVEGNWYHFSDQPGL